MMVCKLKVCFAMLLIAVAAPGCMLSVVAQERRSGPQVPRSTLARIVPGETTREWVIKRLGPPTSVGTLSDGTELLRYVQEIQINSEVAIAFLISLEHTAEVTRVVTIEIKDGIVQDYYQRSYDYDDGDYYDNEYLKDNGDDSDDEPEEE